MRIALAAALLLAVPLPGCANLTPPANVANHTIADERAAIALELAYTSAARAGTSLARAGIIDAAKFGDLDRKAYAALLVARAAYRTANAADYAAAVGELQSAVAAMNALLEKVP